ncbi:MAG: helix-turn-helix domain-containing protein [Oscillospiraceae bacterium]|nr:helix-turn-helix domain-containing protein [Oscillospiraceae bacterium]
MEIGNQIKALRAQRGITQETLAEKLNVSAQAVSKWERGAATPDIQLLPAISAYFGVSIDELFSLSDETRMERIQNMLWDERTLNPNTAEAERAFLLEKGKREPNNGEVYRLLADIEYQLSEEHRRAAVEYAKEGLKREPENNGVHSTFVQASQGEWGAWYSVEHHELIDFYKKFVAENPGWRSGYLWLIDQLIADNRLDEASLYTDKMAENTDAGYRTAMYRGEIAWADGRHDDALAIWDEMSREYADEFGVWMRMGDYMAKLGRYEDAKAHYRKSMEIQTKFPRWLDGVTSTAHICEIQGDYDGAISAHEEELQLLRDEWKITSGEEVDQHHREIVRLQAKKDNMQ